MTVLVTGVGFIGGYVVRDLVAAGEKVVVYGYLGGNGDPNGELPEVEYIDHLIGGGVRDNVEIVVGDAGDLDALTAAAERHSADRIVHFATMLASAAQSNPWLSTRINVMGTANAFEVAARLQMDKVVWMSSSSVFGERSIPASGRVSDDSQPDPDWAYGASKLMGEKLAIAFADNHGINITGVRPTRVYGFGEYVKLARGGASGWLNNLLYHPAVTSDDETRVVPFGRRPLNFLYVEDVSDGVLKALDFKEPEGASSYLFSGDHRLIAEAFDFVHELLPEAKIALDMEDGALKKGAALAFAMDADSSRATRDFGFAASHSMEAGVYKTLNANRIYAGLPPIPQPAKAMVGSNY
jgi:nucleoside-diphosphate-sugar epimerase